MNFFFFAVICFRKPYVTYLSKIPDLKTWYSVTNILRSLDEILTFPKLYKSENKNISSIGDEKTPEPLELFITPQHCNLEFTKTVIKQL